jgi:hypothetical protein
MNFRIWDKFILLFNHFVIPEESSIVWVILDKKEDPYRMTNNMCFFKIRR